MEQIGKARRIIFQSLLEKKFFFVNEKKNFSTEGDLRFFLDLKREYRVKEIAFVNYLITWFDTSTDMILYIIYKSNIWVLAKGKTLVIFSLNLL